MKKILLLGLVTFSSMTFAITDDELGKMLRFQDLVNIAIDNNNYDLACKAQSEIYDIAKKAQIRDMIQKSKDQKNAYCSVKKYSLWKK